MLSQLGPLFSYVPNASKTYPVVSDKFVTAARHTFSDTRIVISTDGHRHLGAALGHKDYTEIYDALLLRQYSILLIWTFMRLVVLCHSVLIVRVAVRLLYLLYINYSLILVHRKFFW